MIIYNIQDENFFEKFFGFILARSAPFKLGIFTNGNEDLADAASEQAASMGNVNEISTPAGNQPFGSQGFSIGYAQISCE